MTRRQVKVVLAAYFLIFFGAVFLRIDYFPLSWVPMYGHREATGRLPVVIGDVKRRSEGFEALRANGERFRISRDDLNIPAANFRRLYQERAYGEGPPQHRRERLELAPFNRWWYETLIGTEDPATSWDYPGDLLKSFNRTFGHAADDPRRIVELRTQVHLATFTRDQLDSGQLSQPALLERHVAIITEQGTQWVREPLRD